jgi:hypothetical protein
VVVWVGAKQGDTGGLAVDREQLQGSGVGCQVGDLRLRERVIERHVLHWYLDDVGRSALVLHIPLAGLRHHIRGGIGQKVLQHLRRRLVRQSGLHGLGFLALFALGGAPGKIDVGAVQRNLVQQAVFQRAPSERQLDFRLMARGSKSRTGKALERRHQPRMVGFFCGLRLERTLKCAIGLGLTLHDRVHQGAQRRELMLGAQRQQRQSGVRVALEGRRKADFAGAFIELEVRQQQLVVGTARPRSCGGVRQTLAQLLHQFRWICGVALV